MEIIYILSILIFLFNIPFGIWRSQKNKFSLEWFLAIHLPVIFILIARFYFKIPYSWKSLFLFVIPFFLGQLLGKVLGKRIYN